MAKTGEELFLYYKGPVLYDTIGELISGLKERMFEAHVKQAVYKKVLMIMIEALENVFKYHEYFDKDKSLLKRNPPEFVIVRIKQNFSISCSNPVLKTHVEPLLERLKYICSLDKSGVKEEYKTIITNGHFSEKGGAGLGLIEMAKISDAKISYSFTPIDKKYDYYSLTISIDSNV